MALPNVNVTITNGALGSVADSPDGVAAMVMSGVSITNMPLATPKVIYSLPDAEALGITSTGTNAAAHRHIKEFYAGYQYITGREVAELYIMTVADTMTLTQMADGTEPSGAKKLVDFAAGRVRLLGLTRNPAGSYTPVVTDGIDKDSIDALQKAHALGESYAAQQVPIRTLVEGRAFALANLASLKDLHQSTFPRAGCVLMSTKNDGSASVGFILGVLAGLPVQRKISRVKNGQLPLTDVYIGDTRAELVTGIGTIHDKGYIAARTFPQRSGYYITDDPMAALVSDDYAMLCRGRVIDKAHRIAYDVYVEELNDDIELEEGRLPGGFIAYLTERITDRINKSMAGEISGSPGVSIDPNQNILATGKTRIKLKIQPVGYNQAIEVDLGLDNPANG